MTPDETPDLRGRVLQEFQTWLYQLTDESLDAMESDGLEELRETDGMSMDFFRLFGAFSALRQEVKLQSKTLQTAGRKLESLADTLPEQIRAELVAFQKDFPQLGTGDSPENPRRPELTELIAVRDSLAQALIASEAYRIPKEKVPRQPWLRKPHLGMEAMVQTLDRLVRKVDDVFYRLGVSAMVEIGMPFEPEKMRAVSVSSGLGQSGEVTAVVRQGYRWKNHILQLPEVQVEK